VKNVIAPPNWRKLTNFFGCTLLLYFIVETAMYVASGRLLYEANILIDAIKDLNPLYIFYHTGRLLSITVLPLYMIRAKKTDNLFILAAILFIALGNIYNPFQVFFRKQYVPGYGELRVIPNYFGICWSGACLFILGMMKYHAKKEKKNPCPVENRSRFPSISTSMRTTNKAARPDRLSRQVSVLDVRQ
jgi:hypothetical protein